MANYENFYSGTKSTFQPEYSGFESYRLIKNIGSSINPATANQISEVNNLLNQGMKTIEFSALSPEIFETVPKEHLKEINRLSKLTGNEMTFHGPRIDTAGFKVTERGVEGWSDYEREEAEGRIKDSVIRAHELNPEGNIPVVIHASELPAESVKKGEVIWSVNQETGQLLTSKKEKRFYPGGEGVCTPEDEIQVSNNSQWADITTNLVRYKKYGDEELNQAYASLGEKLSKELSAKGHIEEEGLSIEEKQRVEAFGAHLDIAKALYDDVEAKFRSIYHQAWKYGVEKERTDIPEEKREDEKRESRKRLEKINKIWAEAKKSGNPLLMSEAVIKLRDLPPPQIYKPVEDFALQHSAKTLGNAAFAGYEKFKNTAPIIAVENMFPNMAFSSAEQLSKLINESRKVFADNAVKKGISRTDAENQAEKLIGATWDIGHLNLLRKGYSEEEAERLMLSQTKEIAPLVKHVHISDNFGHADTHLPPGMGNVPVKKLMEELEKKGYSGKQIMEIGGFAQHFKVSSYPYILENLDSPMYAQQLGPTWSQAKGLYGSYYFSGYGPTLPEQHMGMYGAGFSGLPSELGGQTGGTAGKRFAGAPME